MKIGQRYIRRMLAAGILPALLLTGCMGDEGDCTQTNRLDGKSYLTLTFVTPNDGTATRAAGSTTRAAENDPDGYEEGIGYEDYINISGGDYKIYFFTYGTNDTKGGTLIAEFTPDEVTSSSTLTTTIYTVTGDVPSALLTKSDFRVVMLANWGSYQSVEEGTTTIDDLCEGEYSTFMASNKFTINQNNLIPFYGVQEYAGVTFGVNKTTKLDAPVNLLRAVSKVEVIMTGESELNVFDDVSIVNYNSQGYCAPAGVYVAADYDTSASKNPNTSDWPDEWVKGLHLVSKDSNGNGINDTDNGDTSNPKTRAFTHISSYDATNETLDTWRIYLPEYNNMGTDYSYITVTIDGQPYNIYFAEYDESGLTTAYGEEEPEGMPDRQNLKRNNLYRYYVTLAPDEWEFSLEVEKWTSPLGIEEVPFYNDINYEQDNDNMTIIFNLPEVTSTFSMTPTLLYNGVDISEEVTWTWEVLNIDEEVLTVGENGKATVTSLTATPGYTYDYTITAEWNGTKGVKSITYNITVSLYEGWPDFTMPTSSSSTLSVPRRTFGDAIKKQKNIVVHNDRINLTE